MCLLDYFINGHAWKLEAGYICCTFFHFSRTKSCIFIHLLVNYILRKKSNYLRILLLLPVLPKLNHIFFPMVNISSQSPNSPKTTFAPLDRSTTWPTNCYSLTLRDPEVSYPLQSHSTATIPMCSELNDSNSFLVHSMACIIQRIWRCGTLQSDSHRKDWWPVYYPVRVFVLFMALIMMQ